MVAHHMCRVCRGDAAHTWTFCLRNVVDGCMFALHVCAVHIHYAYVQYVYMCMVAAEIGADAAHKERVFRCNVLDGYTCAPCVSIMHISNMCMVGAEGGGDAAQCLGRNVLDCYMYTLCIFKVCMCV